MKTQSQTWRQANPERARELSRISMQKMNLRKYGYTLELYQEMWRAQNGLCALPSCGKPIGAADHDHATGLPRALLCGNHNAGLGFFSDSPQLLREAIEYLLKYQEQHSAEMRITHV